MGGKGIYIPSIDELNQIKEILKDERIINNYCLAKKIEYIVANGGLEYFGSYEKEDRYVVEGVLKYHPTDIWCTPFNNDYKLATMVVTSNRDTNYTFGLDALDAISEQLQQEPEFIQTVIKTLYGALIKDPSYRFYYQPSSLLDAIFEKKLYSENKNLSLHHEYTSMLLSIEPSYVLYGSYYQYYKTCIVEYITRYTKIWPMKEDQTYTKKLVKFLQDHKEF